ncbi:MAG: DUF3876 domain-containing protein [Prevotella sp.]|nr:DUF3876 domain-containing protein [Prevotella sp.]
MKTLRHSLLLLVLSAFTACSTKPIEYPSGRWYSVQNRPDITFEGNHGSLIAIVHHKTYSGDTCSIVYPVITTNYGFYIQAEGKIHVFYDTEKDALFLSPGGEYERRLQ